MFKIKVAVLAAAATFALAAPSFAQNFQGFGAPSEVTQGYGWGQAQNKPVALKTKKRVKAVH
jgi:hypothetical protein